MRIEDMANPCPVLILWKNLFSAGIFKQSIGARNQVEIGL
jgi:hypothetical protein